MKKKMLVGIAVALAVISSAVLTSTAANAATGAALPAGTTWASSGSPSVQLSDVDQVTTKGKVTLAYRVATGIKLTKKEQTAKVYTVKYSKYKTFSAFANANPGATVAKVYTKVRFNNSGYSVARLLHILKDYIGSPISPGPYQTFVKRDGHWYKKGGPNGGNCGNEIFVKKKPDLSYTQVIFVRSFSQLKWTGKATATSTGYLIGSAEVDQPGCTAASAFSLFGSATATASLSVQASTKSEATKKLSAKATAYKLQESSSLDFNAQLNASSKVNLSGSATAECSSSAPPSSTPTPGPMIITITQLNDVDLSRAAQQGQPAQLRTVQVCATAIVSGSDSGTMTFSTDYGSIQEAGSEKTYTTPVTGQSQCATYVAPTELPPTTRVGPNGDIQHYATITVTVRDTTNTDLAPAVATTAPTINQPIVRG